MRAIRELIRWVRDVAAKPRAEQPRPAPEPAPPVDPRELYLAAVKLLEAGRFEDAEATFLRYAAASETRGADGFAGAARAVWGLRGNRELDAAAGGPSLPPEHRDRALAHYRRALAAAPGHVRSMLGLALLLERADPQRQSLLRRAAELEPSPAVLLLLGDACRDAGETDEALLIYEEAVKRWPPELEPYQRLAALCEALGRAADARRWRRAASERYGPGGRDTVTRRRRAADESLAVPAAPVWCVVANIAEAYPAGRGGVETRHGTRLLAPGAKVYVLPPQWGDGGERLEVVSRHRRSHRWISVVVPAKLLRNARAKCVYSPHVLREVRGHWDGSADSRRCAEAWAAHLNAGSGGATDENRSGAS